VGADELRGQIRDAFPAETFGGAITECDCEECLDIRAGLRNKRWDEIPAAFLDFTCSPTLLEAEAYRAFLPAYMLRALDNLSEDSVVTEFTVYSLCPHENHYKGPWLQERVRLMNPYQIEAIRAFLLFAQEHSEEGDWFRPMVARALEEVWR
jgi:hypothetical protein